MVANFIQKGELPIPEEIIRVTNSLTDAGCAAYIVGGSVRDLLLDKTPTDWDVATDAQPEAMLEIFEHAHYDNDFGTVRVVNDTENDSLKTVEVTTYRTENEYSDNRHPDTIQYAETIDADLKRRDFTINALALDASKVSRDNTVAVSQETVIDNHGGLADLREGIIRTVGKPTKRFEEDALRILRAARFAAQLRFTIETDTIKAMERSADRLNDIAIERIREEFEKIIASEQPKLGMEITRKIQALDVFIPELVDTIGVEQNQAHEYDLWTHLVNTLQATADKDWAKHIRLAALFHDVGKVQTKEWDEARGDWSFHNHEVVGAHITQRIMERMKFSNAITESVVNLVRWHMFYSDTDDITHSAVRRLIRNVGRENVWDLMKLRRADRLGMGRPKEQPYRLRKYQSMIEEVIRDPVSVSNLAIDGNDVIRETDEAPGPRIGYILHALLEEVLEDPNKNNKTFLVKRVKELADMPNAKLKELGEAGKKEKKRHEEAAKEKIRNKYHVE